MYPDAKEDLDILSMRYLNEDRDYRDDLLRFKESIQGKAPKTKVARLNAVRVFLSDNEVNFPTRFFKNLNGKTQEAISDEEMATKTKIWKLLNYMPPQGKAFTTFLACTGMRGNEAVQLRISDVWWESDVPKVKIPASITKTGHSRISFVTPECKKVLEEWLRYRPTYIEQARKRGAFRRMKKYDYEGLLFPFKSSTFNFVWRNALEKAGMLRVDPVTKWATLKPHNLRKFFRLMGGRYGRDEAEALMGHQTGLNRVYARFEGRAGDKRLEEVYRQAIPDLSIHETQEVNELRGIREEMNVIREENQALKERINGITETRRESDNIMDRLFEDPDFKTLLRQKLKELI
jgi:integrase